MVIGRPYGGGHTDGEVLVRGWPRAHVDPKERAATPGRAHQSLATGTMIAAMVGPGKEHVREALKGMMAGEDAVARARRGLGMARRGRDR